MASVDWQKHTKQSISAMRKHNGRNERMNYEHGNKHIDKSKSHLNVFIGNDDFKDMYKEMLARVAEVDALYPPLKKLKSEDRVICEILEYKCPQAIYDLGYQAAVQFFEDVHKIMQMYFGTANVHGACVHFDEIHEYTDSKSKKTEMSLPHAHELVSCYCEWTDEIKKGRKKTGETRARKGINGKNFEKRSRYNELNKLVDDYCMDKYGIHYMTGKEARHKTVEVLKAETELVEKQMQVEKEQKAVEELQRQADQVRLQKENDEQAASRARQNKEADERDLEEIQQQVKQAQNEKEELQKFIESARDLRDKYDAEAENSWLEAQAAEHFAKEALKEKERLIISSIPPMPEKERDQKKWRKEYAIELQFADVKKQQDQRTAEQSVTEIRQKNKEEQLNRKEKRQDQRERELDEREGKQNRRSEELDSREATLEETIKRRTEEAVFRRIAGQQITTRRTVEFNSQSPQRFRNLYKEQELRNAAEILQKRLRR